MCFSHDSSGTSSLKGLFTPILSATLLKTLDIICLPWNFFCLLKRQLWAIGSLSPLDHWLDSQHYSWPFPLFRKFFISLWPVHNFGYKWIMLKTRKMMKNHLGTTRWWISCGLRGWTFWQRFWSLWVSADEQRSSTLELNDSLLTFTKVDFPLHPCTILSMPHWINQDSEASLTLAYWCHSWKSNLQYGPLETNLQWTQWMYYRRKHIQFAYDTLIHCWTIRLIAP